VNDGSEGFLFQNGDELGIVAGDVGEVGLYTLVPLRRRRSERGGVICTAVG
jgi:hypothetical protein